MAAQDEGPAQPGELERLRELETNYRITVQVLAVVVERYLDLARAGVMVVDDAALSQAPDLDAQRDDRLGRISLATSR